MLYLVEIELYYENNIEYYYSNTKNIVHLVETKNPKDIETILENYYKPFSSELITYKINKINYINKIIK